MSWRLEPTPRSTGIEEGLAARIHDPLWLLARQWQTGEFRAQDAGTPAVVTVAGATTPVNAWRGAQQTDWTPFDGTIDPLDALVEPEDESSPNLRERLEAGAHFLRLLNAAGFSSLASAFVSAHAFDPAVLAGPDFAADALLSAIAKRTPDGLPLHDTATALAGGAPQPVAIDPSDLAGVVAVANAWLAWYGEEIASTPNSGTDVTWQEHRMEYGFAVSNPGAGGTVLVADQYLGDGLDWFDFDIDPGATAGSDGTSTPVSAKAVPTPVRYGGMPLPRFWAMEDSSYDFGSVDAAPNDIGRLLLVEFATVYGNDWYVLPIKLPVGSLTLLDSVVVSDVFGRNLLVMRAGEGEPQWNLFSLDTRGAAHPAQDGLFLPPSAAYLGESAPVESVQFLRDEMADLAWAVETKVQDGLERVIDRRSTWVAPGKLPPGTRDLPAYRVETVVPDYWLPLAPEQLADQKSIRLRLVPMEVDVGGTPQATEPKGRLLVANDSGGRLWLFEEEVPREGTLVDRLYRYARWQDGRTTLWTARRRQTGRGEGSSGLRFDILDPD
ncbi:MAG TPA: hypothetical protein VKB79_12575 [Bryobacteraceae bacterium]|nr:hypothetical protein [Bryobacteraceae bacterium]